MRGRKPWSLRLRGPTPDLQFVVRTLSPAGDRAFSHVFREDAAGSRFAGQKQANDIIRTTAPAIASKSEILRITPPIKVPSQYLELRSREYDCALDRVSRLLRQ
jgi:hypothetical protein